MADETPQTPEESALRGQLKTILEHHSDPSLAEDLDGMTEIMLEEGGVSPEMMQAMMQGVPEGQRTGQPEQPQQQPQQQQPQQEGEKPASENEPFDIFRETLSQQEARTARMEQLQLAIAQKLASMTQKPQEEEKDPLEAFDEGEEGAEDPRYDPLVERYRSLEKKLQSHEPIIQAAREIIAKEHERSIRNNVQSGLQEIAPFLEGSDLNEATDHVFKRLRESAPAASYKSDDQVKAVMKAFASAYVLDKYRDQLSNGQQPRPQRAPQQVPPAQAGAQPAAPATPSPEPDPSRRQPQKAAPAADMKPEEALATMDALMEKDPKKALKFAEQLGVVVDPAVLHQLDYD